MDLDRAWMFPIFDYYLGPCRSNIHGDHGATLMCWFNVANYDNTFGWLTLLLVPHTLGNDP